ncbi:MAG: hydantoinase/oxoprolinase family protein [Thermomicrobiales bacterium]
MSGYRVAMDIGGTFTDFVVHDLDSGRDAIGKVLSTPPNLAEGVVSGLRALVPDPAAIELIVHGTTVGLNAFLERRGARVLLITTHGFKDIYAIARGDRKRLYDLHYRKPAPLVPQTDIHTVRERVRWDGTVQEPLHSEDLAPIVAAIRAEGIGAVAVCLIHANVNPEHELEVRRLLRAAVPEVSISLSHEVAREWREYERTSTVALNAYIAPPTLGYLQRLEGELANLGVPGQLHVMQSNGGVMTATAARRLPIQTLLSGPVGGAIGGAALSRDLGKPNLLCVDMGGTSFDLSLVINGALTVSPETSLEGLPVLMAVVDIHTIGAGGGSLAWLEAGALRVGPRSAGASPGPACYGRGGEQPTVTDANLLLGRLNPDYFLAGGMPLDRVAAERALAGVATQLGLSNEALAEGMLSIINAKMADAMRTITVRRGIDPREFSLVAYGGAGPMHAVALAAELDISEVIVPVAPGAFSAMGMLETNIRHDLSRTFYAPLAETLPDQIDALFAELEAHGRAVLRDEQIPAERMLFICTADMRYVGQEYFINVTVPREGAITAETIRELDARFHGLYETRYGHATLGAPIEIVNLRIAAVGLLPERRGGAWPDGGAHEPATRLVRLDGVPHQAAILRRDRLPVGAFFSGPAIIEEETATTVLPPGWQGRIDELGNLVLTLA